MLRHTAFFLHRDSTTPALHLEMLKGLAFLRSECEGPVAGDYGDDLFGGSKPLREVKPWKRTPRWTAAARESGPPCNYDAALHLDFDDEAGLDAYNGDDVHHAIGDFNASINDPELTARLDWWYEGGPLTRPGLIRHTALFLWTDESDAGQRRRALDAVRRFESAPGVESVVIGESVGTFHNTTDFHWLYDVQLADGAATEAFLASDLYRDVLAVVAPLTKYEWTARLSHVMRGT
jgi:hypothetical protein